MSQSIFEQMKSSLDEIVQGRKFLISTMEKLKKNIPDLGPTLEQLSEGIKSLEAFGRIASQIQGRLDGMEAGVKSVNNMAVAMENLKGEIQQISNNYLSFKPMLEAIKDSNDRQEKALQNLSQNIQQLGTLMGNILAKLG
ncbi:MAG: hypothetical protein GF364_11395 [Candidatus Lokiarchaeota archaeon]|nr:hypothetical protein [Candidatus Lokiarchaeota archaeon]